VTLAIFAHFAQQKTRNYPTTTHQTINNECCFVSPLMSTTDISNHDSLEAQQYYYFGIDFGTTHSTVAIYDSTRARPKWIRLSCAFLEEKKQGRIVPSCLLLSMRQLNSNFHPLPQQQQQEQELASTTDPSLSTVVYACVGAPALIFDAASPHDLHAALITNLKQYVTGHAESSIKVTPLYSSNAIWIKTRVLLQHLVQTLVREATAYVRANTLKKQFRVPLTQSTPNVVVGVPAAWTMQQRQYLVEAICTTIGSSDGDYNDKSSAADDSTTVDSTILPIAASCLMESTAAAMAYGMLTNNTSTSNSNINSFENSQQKPKCVLVLDCGGGTTDITIATQQNNRNAAWSVVATHGILVGGNHVDEAFLHYLHESDSDVNDNTQQLQLDTHQRADLLRQCQRAKETLCSSSCINDNNNIATATIVWQGQRRTVTMQDLNQSLEPILQSIQSCIERALQKYAAKTSSQSAQIEDYSTDSTAHAAICSSIDEVILVGGSSRLPAVQDLLRRTFPHVKELCTSVHPMSAVAQGTCVQAVMTVLPAHQLVSAMMLDTLPYAIGILCRDDQFISVLPAGATLPAKGRATFALERANQQGVTVATVEAIMNQGDDEEVLYEPIQEFTFLLHRCTTKNDEGAMPNAVREIDIGMLMKPSGELVVSILDPNDPEHVARNGGVLPDHTSSTPREQVVLMGLCIVLFVLYAMVKIAFTKERLLYVSGENVQADL
jgi:molecular chaperone DnaK (HSP70)